MINDFKSLFNQKSTIINNDLVVGLSGGSDSIFLLFYIKHLKEHFGFLGSVFPIIVDHGPVSYTHLTLPTNDQV